MDIPYPGASVIGGANFNFIADSIMLVSNDAPTHLTHFVTLFVFHISQTT